MVFKNKLSTLQCYKIRGTCNFLFIPTTWRCVYGIRKWVLGVFFFFFLSIHNEYFHPKNRLVLTSPPPRRRRRHYRVRPHRRYLLDRSWKIRCGRRRLDELVKFDLFGGPVKYIILQNKQVIIIIIIIIII